MNLSCLNLASASEKPAFILPGSAQVITYTELHRAILELDVGSHSRNRAVILKPEASIAFLIRFLAHLYQKHTIVLWPKDNLDPDSDPRRQALGAAVEFDVSGKMIWKSDSKEQKHHPDARLIFFTSGSSGVPKAVQLSDANICANIKAVRSSLNFDGAQEQSLFLPLSYSFGMLGQLLPGLEAGVSTQLFSHFAEVARHVHPEMSGMWSGVPSHWEIILRILNDSVSAGRNALNVTHVISAGAFLSGDLRCRLRKAFPEAVIYNNYGLTEASPRVLSMSSLHPKFFSDATGFLIGDWRSRLSEVGELCVAGPQIMLGYLGDQASTAERIQSGWLLTRDMAEIDENGLVTVTDRIDGIFNVSGEKISQAEIDLALRCVDGVIDLTLGKIDDSIYGSRLVALLVCADEVVALGREAMVNKISKKLALPKIPKDFRRVSYIPRNENGKISNSEFHKLLKEADKIWT